MIYVMRSAGFDKNNNLTTLLKIGYTKDDSKKSRFDCYITENPTIKILYLIENGTEMDEKYLHHHFKNLLIMGQEWFKDDYSIIEFFNTHKTVESLDEIKQDSLISVKDKNTINLNKKEINNVIKVNTVLNLICSKYDINYKEVENQLYLNVDHIEDYININYPDIDYKDRFSVFSVLSSQIGELEDVNSILDQFYSISDITERYEYLCSLDESIVQSILSHLPSTFINYYTVLGPVKMKALGFHATRMKKEYEGIIGNQSIDIRQPILDTFKVGEIYSKSDAKKMLKKIYDNCGYHKAPKAMDLGDYFIIKNCMVTNKITGKRDNCYEIVKIKSEGD